MVKDGVDGPRIQKEMEIVGEMILIYCKKIHQRSSLCEQCRELLNYAIHRLSYCPFGEKKPACARCLVHCYAPNNREKIKDVMRTAGPWMLLTHPIEAVRHLPIYNILNGVK